MPAPFRAPGFDAPLVPTAAQRAGVRRAAAQAAAQLAALDDQALRAVLPALVDARAELRHGLLEWLKNAPDGNERFTAQRMRVALANLEGARTVIRERLGIDMYDAIEGFGAEAGRLSIQNLEFEVARFSAVFGQSVRPTQLQTAAILAKGDKLLIPRYRTSAARYAGNVLQDIRHQFAVGVARGETFEQLTNRLRRLGGPRGRVALRGKIGDPGAIVEDISEGLFRRYRHWSERLVRTEMINAYSVQHIRGIEALNADLDDDEEPYLKRLDATLDARTCPICRRLDGATAPVNGTFPGGYYQSPIHPMCRCAVTAWHPSWGESPASVDEPRSPNVRATRSPARRAAPYAEAMQQGDLQAARASMEEVLDGRYYRQPRTTSAVNTLPRSKLPPDVEGFNEWNGEIAVSVESVQGARRLAEAWKSDRRGIQQRFDAAARDLRDGSMSEGTAKILDQLDDHVTFSHEVLHGYGPLKGEAEFSKSLTHRSIEDLSTEVVARRWVRRRFEVPDDLPVGKAYQDEIDIATEIVGDVYRVSKRKASAMIERASTRLKTRAPEDNKDIVDQFADGFGASKKEELKSRLAKASWPRRT